MHPLDVADLLDDEMRELQRQVGDRDDLRIRQITRPEPIEIRVQFGAKAYASELVSLPDALVVAGAGGAQVQARWVPLLGASSARELVLRARCADWDGQPPEIDLLDASGEELVDWPRDSTGQGIVHNHPEYSRPFFCRPGTCEYHTHPVHRDDPWDKHREGLTIAGILIPLLHDLVHRWTLR